MSPDGGTRPPVGPVPHGDGRYVVSAVIPAFNAMRFLGNCLASVLAAAECHGAVEVIVVDNGSTDGTWNELQLRRCDWVRALQVPGATIATLRNRGAALARGQYLAFLDSDCEVPRDYFRAVDAVLSSGEWQASGSAVALPRSPHWIERTWHGLHRRSAHHVLKYINSGNLAVTRAAFQRVGGFREDLITDEDVDFCTRLVAAGLRMREHPSIAAIHHGNPKSLAAFVRREAWHATRNGERGGHVSRNMPNLAALAHLLCCATAIALALFGGSLSVLERVGLAIGGQGIVPVLAVGYRLLRGGRAENLPAALLLYYLYLDSRVATVAAALVRPRD